MRRHCCGSDIKEVLHGKRMFRELLGQLSVNQFVVSSSYCSSWVWVAFNRNTGNTWRMWKVSGQQSSINVFWSCLALVSIFRTDIHIWKFLFQALHIKVAHPFVLIQNFNKTWKKIERKFKMTVKFERNNGQKKVEPENSICIVEHPLKFAKITKS